MIRESVPRKYNVMFYYTVKSGLRGVGLVFLVFLVFQKVYPNWTDGEQGDLRPLHMEDGRRMEADRDREGGYGRLRTGQCIRMSKSRGGGVMRRAASELSARQGARYQR